jgi:hypothetical protein
MPDIDIVCDRDGIGLRINGAVYPVTLQKNGPGRGWCALLEGYVTPQGPLIGDGRNDLEALASLLEKAGWSDR